MEAEGRKKKITRTQRRALTSAEETCTVRVSVPTLLWTTSGNSPPPHPNPRYVMADTRKKTPQNWSTQRLSCQWYYACQQDLSNITR